MRDTATTSPMPTTLVRSAPGTGSEVIGIAGINTDSATIVESMPVWKMVAIRVLRAYLQTFLGLWGAQASGIISIKVELSFAAQWGLIGSVLLAALAPTFLSLVQNAVEFLTDLDTRAPRWRA